MSNTLQFAFPPDAIDFDATKDKLEEILARSNTWSGVIDNQVGTALIDIISTVNVFAQNRILACFREVFPETLSSDRASFALAFFQGVRLNRNSPATCTVTLVSPEPVSLPPFTRFVVGGNLSLFNRDQIFLRPDIAQQVTLAEGTVKTLKLEGLGTDYQAIVPLERDFVVSDQDVAVAVDGANVPRVTDGLWNYRDQPAFQDATLPDGRLLMRFGTAVFGYRPRSGSEVLVYYAITRGTDGNSLGATGETLYCPLFPTVKGTMEVALSGGADRRAAIEYKNVEAPNFGSFGSAVKKSQYVSTALQFPKVVDVRTFSQREVDPTDVRWMNLIKIVPLVQAGWTFADQEALISYMEESTMYATRFYVEYPTARPVDINIRAFCNRWANPTSVRNSIIEAIQSLFVMKKGVLERNLFLSSISDAVRSANTDIQHFDIIKPYNSVIVSTDPVGKPQVTMEAGTGLLDPGLYIYGIAAVVQQDDNGGTGYLKVTNTQHAVATDYNSGAVIRWDPLPNAVEYHVYGRSTAANGFGLLHTYVPTELESSTNESLVWTDIGNIPVGAPPPTKSDVKIQYVTLNTLDVSVTVTRN
jgi:hypothetical protein